MKVVIGSDHAGFDCKEAIIVSLKKLGYTTIDKGTYSKDSVDYPDFAHPVANAVQSKEADYGILVCGSGNGVCITANKHKEIRAALCWTVGIAQLARQHNDANVVCIPARFVGKRMATNIVKNFLSTEFEGGRHQTRVSKISC